MTKVLLRREARDPMGDWNRCRDFDEDCPPIKDKVDCWLYDPEKGWCPYLRTT